ncbi:MAG: family type secretion target [Glaciihabitans sp.]|nr:family type secretion target [Glaciihabitans sp.]
MTQYQVDSDAVLNATGAVRATIGRLEGEVSSLNGQLANLQGSWTGQAASAFQSVFGEWRATEQHVQQNLAALGHALNAAAQQYSEIESTNARLFQR